MVKVTKVKKLSWRITLVCYSVEVVNMLTDIVTTMTMVSWFSVTQDPVETCYVRVLQGLMSNSLVPYGISNNTIDMRTSSEQ